jgi:hypothetical protein
MDREPLQTSTPPADVDVDEGLDAYGEELTETFPASDVPASVHP